MVDAGSAGSKVELLGEHTLNENKLQKSLTPL